MKYRVFVIQAHMGENPDSSLTDAVTLELIDETYPEAIARAKNLIDKKFYRLSRVFEGFSNDKP